MPKLKRCSSATQVRRATTRLQTYRECRNNGVQLSESTATTRLQPTSPDHDSPVASMSEISNSTTQQHTPCLEFSTAVLSTPDISDSLQQQQHAAGLSTAASDFSVSSMSGVSNNFQHTQEHESGFELSISTSNNDSPTSDNLQHAQQHVTGLEFSISTSDSPVISSSDIY